MILSMVSATLRVFKPTSASAKSDAASADMEADDSQFEYKSYLVIGTAYALHDEDEPTKGRVLVLSCNPEDEGATANSSQRSIRTVTELQVRGGVYSMCQFYDGKLLVTVNSKTVMCNLVNEGTGVVKLAMVGVGHHGHILSLFVTSRANKSLMGKAPALDVAATAMGTSNDGKEAKAPQDEPEMLAVVGDLMRSISLVQYYPQHETLEEVARDFNANWTTAVAMLTDDVYLGGENWNNLFVLRRNTKAQSEEIRCRLDTVGEFHLGEMCNKFMSGSLVMPSSTSSESSATAAASRNRRRSLASPKKGGDSGKVPASSSAGATNTAAVRSRRPGVAIGSQTLFGTVDGTLGVILGLDGPTAAFFSCLERSMQRVITPVGNFSHQQFRAFNAEQRLHPSHGFVDGDLVESFLDLDKNTMEAVVEQMNRDGGWEIDDSAFSAAGANEKDEEGNVRMEDDQRPELAVDDVLAVVEEMTMLH
jgi:DNA damage-binding protein 1